MTTKKGTKQNTKLLKEDHINVRCTTEQKATIDTAAGSEGLGASTWLLQLGLLAAERKKQMKESSR